MELDIDIDMDGVAAAVRAALNASQARLTSAMDKARKALAVAEDPSAAEPVRKTAKVKAAAILARYGLTAAMLADAGQIKAKVDDDTFELLAPYVYDKGSLLATVVLAYGGRVVRTVKSPQRCVYRVFGMDSDMARIKLLWPSLLTQLTNEMAAAVARRTGGERRDVFERSFIHTFTEEVGQRIEAAESTALRDFEDERTDDAAPAGSGKSVALVLAGRKDQVAAAVTAEFPKLRKAPARRLKASREGLSAGREAGRRADIGTNNKLAGSAGSAALR